HHHHLGLVVVGGSYPATRDLLASPTRRSSDLAAKAEKNIEDRLLKVYNKLRGTFRNGLAVVSIERDSCSGCYNKIPPQLQSEIRQRKKIIICEHCGRIIVDEGIVFEEEHA